MPEDTFNEVDRRSMLPYVVQIASGLAAHHQEGYSPQVWATVAVRVVEAIYEKLRLKP